MQDCWTALISAAKEGHIEVVKELLENNANLEHRDMVGLIIGKVFFKIYFNPDLNICFILKQTVLSHVIVQSEFHEQDTPKRDL